MVFALWSMSHVPMALEIFEKHVAAKCGPDCRVSEHAQVCATSIDEISWAEWQAHLVMDRWSEIPQQHVTANQGAWSLPGSPDFFFFSKWLTPWFSENAVKDVL